MGLIIICPLVICSFCFSIKSTNTIYDCTESTISQGIEKLLTEDFGLQLASLCLFSLNVVMFLILIGIKHELFETCWSCVSDCCEDLCSKKDALPDEFVREESAAELKTVK